MKVKRTFPILLILLFATLFVLIINGMKIWSDEQIFQEERLDKVSIKFMAETDAFFSVYISLFNGLAQSRAVIEKETLTLFEYFRRINNLYPEIENVAAVNKDGYFFGSGRDFNISDPPNISQLGFFVESEKTESGYVIMEPHVGPISGSEVTGLVIRLDDEEGDFNGVLGGSIALNKLYKAWEDFSQRENVKVNIHYKEELLFSTLENETDFHDSDYHIRSFSLRGLNVESQLFIYDIIPFAESFRSNTLNILLLIFLAILLFFIFSDRLRESRTLNLLLKSQARFLAIFRNMPDAVLLFDEDKKLSLSNPAFTRLFGYSLYEALGSECRTFFQNSWEELFLTEIPPGTIVPQKTMCTHKKGTQFLGESIGVPVLTDNEDLNGYLLIIRDISEKSRIEEVMIQNEKMLSIGGLAAGMAHEINNPLAGMIQTAEVLSKRLIGGDKFKNNVEVAALSGASLEALKEYMELREIPKMLKSITESGKRISEIVGNMLGFSRKSVGREFQNADISDLMEKAIALSSTDYNLKKHFDFKDITIRKRYEPHIPDVFCASTEIQQVFINLLRNAAEAMKEAGVESPCLDIEIRFDKKEQSCVVELVDNGPGMAENIRKKIFEPFFTTKAIGMGTGLGLSVSYYIITENHKGKMSVSSMEGAGTMFRISIPIS